MLAFWQKKKMHTDLKRFWKCKGKRDREKLTGTDPEALSVPKCVYDPIDITAELFSSCSCSFSFAEKPETMGDSERALDKEKRGRRKEGKFLNLSIRIDSMRKGGSEAIASPLPSLSRIYTEKKKISDTMRSRSIRGVSEENFYTQRKRKRRKRLRFLPFPPVSTDR